MNASAADRPVSCARASCGFRSSCAVMGSIPSRSRRSARSRAAIRERTAAPASRAASRFQTSTSAATPAARARSTQRRLSSSRISVLPTWKNSGGSPAKSPYTGDTYGWVSLFGRAADVHRAHLDAALVAQHRIARGVGDARAVSCGSVRSVSGDIAIAPAGSGSPAVAQRQQHRKRHAAAGGNAAQHDALRGDAELEQLLVRAEAVLVRRPETGARARAGRRRAARARSRPCRDAPSSRAPCSAGARRRRRPESAGCIAVGPAALRAHPLRVAVRKRMVVREFEARRMLADTVARSRRSARAGARPRRRAAAAA